MSQITHFAPAVVFGTLTIRNIVLEQVVKVLEVCLADSVGTMFISHLFDGFIWKTIQDHVFAPSPLPFDDFETSNECQTF